MPPAIYVVTRAGRQRAAPGKSCVLTVGQGRGEGPASCEIPEGPVRPSAVSVVHPGDELAVSIPRTKIIRRPGCDDARECGGRAALRGFPCGRREVRSFALRGGTTRWNVDVPPGAYALEVSIDFTTANELTGDATAVAGLLVDAGRRRAVVRAAQGRACEAN